MRESAETSDRKPSARMDSDSTVLFDPTSELKKEIIVHAAETPENSDLPPATENEEHLASLSHSILEVSLGSKLNPGWTRVDIK